jgi:4-hydroxybenzoyl-CoA reductase subunit gamma
MLAAHALLARGSNPSRAEIEQALGGHVCRCTGYVKIVEAVEALAGGAR